MNEFKSFGDTISFGVVISTLAGWMPTIAAGLSIIWTALRIIESNTIQGWVKKMKDDE